MERMCWDFIVKFGAYADRRVGADVQPVRCVAVVVVGAVMEIGLISCSLGASTDFEPLGIKGNPFGII